MYINTLGPIALWNINQWNISRVTKYFIILTIALGWFFTFSAAGFLFFTLSFIISLVIYRKVHILFTKKTIIFWLGFLAILLINFELITIAVEFMDKIINKITLTSEGVSSNQRVHVLLLAVSRFIENPLLGLGLGYTSSINEMSPLSWYLIILTNGGIFALLLLLLFFWFKFRKIYILKLEGKEFFMIGYLAAIMNLSTTATFFNPFLLILLSILELYRRKSSTTGV